MKIEHIPRLAMTHVSTFVCGYILAVWCNEPSRAHAMRETPTTGFRIVLPAGKTTTISATQDSQNTPIAILRREDSDPTKFCKIVDEGLSALRKGRYIAISGTLQNLEKIAPFMWGSRFRYLDFKNTPDVNSLQPCGNAPAIFYGTH